MSKYRVITETVPWSENNTWKWPAGDEKLVQVFGHVADIDAIMPHVKDTGVCVQAGGACGIWPLRFSQLFDTVYTFEPQPDNFKCLVKNTSEADNIIATNCALADDENTYSIHNDIFERKNYGAGYIIPDANGIKAIRLDSLGLESCGLIQLDVEGAELVALKGAAELIDAFHPTIVLEEKRLNHVVANPAMARNWLERNFGYEQVDAIHKDVILC